MALRSRTESAVAELNALSSAMKRDGHPAVDTTKDILLNFVVGGRGFLPYKKPPSEDGNTGNIFSGTRATYSTPADEDDNDGDDPSSNDGSDDDYYDDDDVELELDGVKTTALTWLRDKIEHTYCFHKATAVPDCPGLAITLHDYQRKAVGMIEHNRNSPLKGTLIADPPGLGKTPVAIAAIVRAIPTASCFSVVVVPASCLDQWNSEFQKFLSPGTARVFVLRNPTTPALELLKYDVVLTTYNFVMSQYRKKWAFIDAIKKIKESGIYPDKLPERPHISLFSDIFSSQSKVKFPYLVLDESSIVKNHCTTTFDAMKELRQLAHACIELSGSLVDKSWTDLFALSQFIDGHPFNEYRKMLRVFGDRDIDSGRIKPPSGMRFSRLINFLSTFVVRRPDDTVPLPQLTIREYKFRLSEEEAQASDQEYDAYKQALSTIASITSSGRLDGVQNFGRRGRRHLSAAAKADRTEWNKKKWAALIKAQQHSSHPSLVDIMLFARSTNKPSNFDNTNVDLPFSAEEYQKWETWRQQIAENRNWTSSRVQAIIRVFNECRDEFPDDSVMIFDESVYFLDIVQIAFERMPEPISCIRFDSRATTDQRTAFLADFAACGAAKVLLISRSAGGVGLNITSANNVILCSPLWKHSWEEQAYKRCWRIGQTKPVRVFKLYATNCKVEMHKKEARDRKAKRNDPITQRLTKEDNEKPRITEELC